MEVDTGASVSLINVSMFNQIKNQNDSIFLTKSKLRTYTSEVVTPTGEVKVNTEYKNQSLCIPVIVMKNRPNLLGRDILKILQSNWFELFNIYVSEISAVYENESLKKILSDYKEISKPELGTLKGVEITLHVDLDAKPCFCRACPVPYALKNRIEKELERLVSEGIYEAIPHSKWAASIVSVIKNDSSIRICGDYKKTINRVSECDRYPVPKTEDLFATLNGREKFSKLDLSHAYHQLLLAPESRSLLIVNTHKGLFQPRHLQFGVHSASGIFQREMHH